MLDRELDEERKVAMVTGASGVLGQATVKMLLEEGFRVVVHDSSLDALNDFMTQLGSLATKENVYPICFDPTNADSVTTACKRIREDFAPVYILVNNCGVLSNSLAAETGLEDWKATFAQNVDSAFLLSKELLPIMKKRKWGRIVNTCNLAGKTGGVTTGVAYASSKGALHTMTFALARESAKDGVTVNGIAPAYIKTPTVEMYTEEMIEMLLKYIPVGRFLEPEEFAHTVKFLISPLSGFITVRSDTVLDQFRKMTLKLRLWLIGRNRRHERRASHGLARRGQRSRLFNFFFFLYLWHIGCLLQRENSIRK